MFGGKISTCDKTDCIHNDCNRCEVCKNPVIAVRIEGGKCKSFKSEQDHLKDKAKRAIVDCFGAASLATLDVIMSVVEKLVRNPSFSVDINNMLWTGRSIHIDFKGSLPAEDDIT